VDPTALIVPGVRQPKVNLRLAGENTRLEEVRLIELVAVAGDQVGIL
jgi:hypothetical protein